MEKFRVCAAVMASFLTFAALFVTEASLLHADPPGQSPPCNVALSPLYGLRLTYLEVITEDMSDPFLNCSQVDNDKVLVMFEVLNWSDRDIAAVVLSLNTGGQDDEFIVNEPPSICTAAFDANGRPFGPACESPVGGGEPSDCVSSNWSVFGVSPSQVQFLNGGTLIPHPQANGFDGLLDPDFAGVPLTECVATLEMMIPGSVGQVCGNVGLIQIPDAETVDDGPNVLDGFTIILDDFNPGERVSFNWYFLDENSNTVGYVSTNGPVIGNSYGFGAFNLSRLGLGPCDAPGPMFEQNGGFDPVDCTDTNVDNPLFWAEAQDPGTGVDEYPINPVPLGVDGFGNWFAVEFAHAITAGFRNEDDQVLQFDGQEVVAGTNSGPYGFLAASGDIVFDSGTGDASFTVEVAIRENPGNTSFPTPTHAFAMGLGSDSDVLEVLSADFAGPLADLNGGAGPDFFAVLIDPNGESGVSIGCIYDDMAGEPIVFGSDPTVVIVLDYQTNAPNLQGVTIPVTTTLMWNNDLGNLPVANIVAVDDGTTRFPAFLDGKIRLIPQGFITEFVRSDCNTDGVINIADAITALCALFDGIGEPLCLDACNANDDAAFNIADPIYTLNWLFSDGPEPPPPFQACGIDTVDSLGCSGSPFCP